VSSAREIARAHRAHLHDHVRCRERCAASITDDVTPRFALKHARRDAATRHERLESKRKHERDRAAKSMEPWHGRQLHDDNAEFACAYSTRPRTARAAEKDLLFIYLAQTHEKQSQMRLPAMTLVRSPF
jgi:hypothetical protein